MKWRIASSVLLVGAGLTFSEIAAAELDAAQPMAAEPTTVEPAAAGHEVPPPSVESSSTGLWGPRFPGRPWEVSVGIDYLRALKEANGLEIDPYRLGLAFSAGYFWPGGFGVAVVGDVYAGSTIRQLYYPPLTSVELDVNVESQLFDVGAQVSYDHPLGPLQLRYSLATYVGFMSWNVGEWPYPSIGGYSTPSGSAVAFTLDPGLSVLWPVGSFFVSAKVHTRISFASELPSAFGGGLGMGVRF